MNELIAELVVERYGPLDRPDLRPDTPEVIRERQRLLASMPGDEEPLPEDIDDQRP